VTHKEFLRMLISEFDRELTIEEEKQRM